MEIQNKDKKKKYLLPCLAQLKHFTPFVVSVDELIGREAKVILIKLDCCLAANW